MKQMTDKAKIYEIVYKILQTVLYVGVAGISVAYIIFLFMGQEKHILLSIEITLMLTVLLLWQADILVRKKLYKSNNIKRNKTHTVAVCLALVGGTFCTVFYAIMSFCNISGAFALVVDIVVLLAILTTATALALEYAVSRKDKVEEADKEESTENKGDGGDN